MSTKIYDGFRFSSTNLTKIHHWIDAFRVELRPLVYDKVAGFLAKEAVSRMDDVYVSQVIDAENRNFLSESWSYLQERNTEIQLSGRRDTRADFSFEIAILPIHRKVLGIFYTEQASFSKLWVGKEFVVDYSYWNNTDRPSGISKRAWEKRESDWAFAIRRHVPALSGFSAQCVDTLLPHPSAEDVLASIPEFEWRTERIAKQRCLDDFVRRNRAEYDRRNDLGLYSAYDWLETVEGKDAFVENKAAISDLLLTSPSVKDIRGW